MERFNNHGGRQLPIGSITVEANKMGVAGSVVYDRSAAVLVGNNGLRTAQNSVVALDFTESHGYNGLGTGAGYTFGNPLAAHSDVHRMAFSAAAVPEPEAHAPMVAGLLDVGVLVGRRRGD